MCTYTCTLCSLIEAASQTTAEWNGSMSVTKYQLSPCITAMPVTVHKYIQSLSHIYMNIMIVVVVVVAQCKYPLICR